MYDDNGAVIAETVSLYTGYYSFGEIVFNANFISIDAEGYEEIYQEFNLDDCNTFDCYPQTQNFTLDPLDDFMLNGTLQGLVSAQLSPMGPVFPVPGAIIIASQALSWDNTEYETISDEDGNYVLELPANETPYTVTCWPALNIGIYLEPITATVTISEGQEIQLDFYFTGWTTEMLAPYNLTAELEYTPFGDAAYLEWNYDLVTPGNQVVFQIYYANGNNPNTNFTLIGETTETFYTNNAGGTTTAHGCYYVTAIGVDGIVSSPSNIACTNDDPPENAVIYGTVFQEWGDAIATVPGVPILAIGLNTGTNQDTLIYETHTNEYGNYEMVVNGGGYMVTATLPDGQTLTQDTFVQIGQEVEVDFTFNSGVEPEHILIGEVICADPNCVVESGVVHAVNVNNEASYEAVIEFGYFIIAVENPGEYVLTVYAEGFETFETNITIEGVATISIEMTSTGGGTDPLAWLISGNGNGFPGDTITIPLYLETTTTFAGLQFIATSTGLHAVGFESEYECFNAEFNEVYGQLFGLMFSLEGCSLDAGEHHLANMQFQILDFWNQEWNETIIDLNEIIVSDVAGNNVPTEDVDGVVTIGLNGDVNGDSVINVLDIVNIVNFILLMNEPDPYESWAADMNSDGQVNVLDIVNIVNLILG